MFSLSDGIESWIMWDARAGALAPSGAKAPSHERVLARRLLIEPLDVFLGN
jgi:hypothetical protein